MECHNITLDSSIVENCVQLFVPGHDDQHCQSLRAIPLSFRNRGIQSAKEVDRPAVNTEILLGRFTRIGHVISTRVGFSEHFKESMERRERMSLTNLLGGSEDPVSMTASLYSGVERPAPDWGWRTRRDSQFA